MADSHCDNLSHIVWQHAPVALLMLLCHLFSNRRFGLSTYQPEFTLKNPGSYFKKSKNVAIIHFLTVQTLAIQKDTHILLLFSIFILELSYRDTFLESTSVLSQWTLFWFILSSPSPIWLSYTAAAIHNLFCLSSLLCSSALKEETWEPHCLPRSAKSELWSIFKRLKLQRLTESILHMLPALQNAI